MSLLMHGRMQLLNSPTAELSFGDARGRTCLPPARPGCCGAALLLISDAGGVDGPSMADRSVAQKAQRGGGGRWPDFFRGVRGAGEDARHALTRPDQTQSNGRRSPPVAVAADDHTEKSVSPEPRILLPAGSAQLDEDRTLCSHALCCAGCHAPSGEYRRLFGLHDIFARHRRHRHARIGVGQHHQHWRCPGGLAFSPSETPSPCLCGPHRRCATRDGTDGPLYSDFAGSGALARRVIVRWADGDNPMLVGVSQTSYVSLTLLVPSRRAVSYQRILPCFR